MSGDPRPSSSARGEQVVALDVGDADLDAERRGELAEPLGESGRVEATGIGDDRDATIDGEAEGFLHLPEERLGEAERRVRGPVPAEDEHRQFRQIVAREHVDLATGEHLAHGGEAVAIEPRRIGDPQRFGHLDRSGSRPAPGGPAKAWAMVSQRSASLPSAVTARSSR